MSSCALAADQILTALAGSSSGGSCNQNNCSACPGETASREGRALHTPRPALLRRPGAKCQSRWRARPEWGWGSGVSALGQMLTHILHIPPKLLSDVEGEYR